MNILISEKTANVALNCICDYKRTLTELNMVSTDLTFSVLTDAIDELSSELGYDQDDE